MNLTARQWSFTAATRMRINRNPHSGDPQDWVDCRGSQPAAGAAVESCRSFPGEGGRDPWRLAWNGCDLGRHRNLQSLSARRYDVFHLSRVAGLRLSGGRPVFPQVPQFSAQAVLASSKLTPTAHLPLDVARGVTLTTWFRQASRPLLVSRRFAAVKSAGAPSEAIIISMVMGKTDAFAFDRRGMLRRESAAYDLRAAGCLIHAPKPNTCRLARLGRAIRRGYGRRNRSQ